MDIDNIGMQYMRKEIFAHIAEAAPDMTSAPNPRWAAYIFDREFADHRHERTLFRSTYRSVLSTLSELLSDEERGQILLGTFDIGNGRQIPRELQTEAELEQELGRTGDFALKRVKKSLQALLGAPLKQYFDIDFGITLKVLKLMYRYQKGLDRGLPAQRLFSFLKMPGSPRSSSKLQPPSFEINDGHAVQDAKNIQRIVDELTVHLGSELGAGQRAKIRSTFMQLANDVGIAEDHLKRRIRGGARTDIRHCRQAYAEAIADLDRLRDTYHTPRLPQRLDLDLLIYLGRVQIDNRNKAYEEVTDAIRQLEFPMRQISAEFIRFNSKFDGSKQGRAIETKVVYLDTIGVFMTDWSVDLRQAIGSAFDITITDRQYEAASANIQRIIMVDAELGWQDNSLSLLDVLALLCTAYASQEHHNAFHYKPYWHGQKNQSPRPFFPLKSQRPLDRMEIPEGRIVYWRELRRWIKYALVDQLPYWELDLELSSHINAVVSQVMETHDIDAMQKATSELLAYAKGNCYG